MFASLALAVPAGELKMIWRAQKWQENVWSEKAECEIVNAASPQNFNYFLQVHSKDMRLGDYCDTEQIFPAAE